MDPGRPGDSLPPRALKSLASRPSIPAAPRRQACPAVSAARAAGTIDGFATHSGAVLNGVSFCPPSCLWKCHAYVDLTTVTESFSYVGRSLILI